MASRFEILGVFSIGLRDMPSLNQEKGTVTYYLVRLVGALGNV